MRVTGYQLRETLRRWELRRKATEAEFRDSIYGFADESKSLPISVGGNLARCEKACARLQEVQQRYNQVVVMTGSESLAYCVKAIGGLGRLEKLWRDAAIEQKDRFDRREARQRLADSEYAVRRISTQAALALADKAATEAGAMRAAIAKANNTEIEIQQLGITEADYQELFGVP